MLDKIIILLLEIGFGLKFNIIGSISLSELVLLGTSFFYLKGSLFRNYPILKKITYLYLGLLLSQIVSELMVGNDISNSLRGYAVTVVSYLHFFFLFSFFVKSRKLIVFALAGMIARRLIFGTEFEGSIAEVMEGEASAFLKFYLAPIAIGGALLLSVFLNKRIASLVAMLIGLVIVILGARSGGAELFLTGMSVYIFLIFGKKITQKKLLILSVSILTIGYGGYAFYVNGVLNNRITGGNAYQLKQTENPYNPVNVLAMGRTEVFVGWVAFKDRFWTGHGAWAKDETGKYRTLTFAIRDTEYREIEQDVIPSHSVLIGTGMQNGIFAFLFMLTILFLFLNKGIKSIRINDPGILIAFNFLFALSWHGLFSPISHFRLTFPLFFAFLLTSFLVKERLDKVRKGRQMDGNRYKKRLNNMEPSIKINL